MPCPEGQEGQSRGPGRSTPVVWGLRNGSDISTVEVPHEETGDPAPYRAAQPRASIPGRGVPVTENQQETFA